LILIIPILKKERNMSQKNKFIEFKGFIINVYIMLIISFLTLSSPLYAASRGLTEFLKDSAHFGASVTKRFMSSNGGEMVKIDESLARRLVAAQFPRWEHLPVKPVAVGGWDNRTFHLGDDKVIRLPSASDYAIQVEKEQRWLPKLAPFLPLSIPEPIGLGKPAFGYPWNWSIYNWIVGETAARSFGLDKIKIATGVASFISALHKIDTKDGPKSGEHNFHRGGLLSIYDSETRNAIAIMKENIDEKICRSVWEKGADTEWLHPSVWVHGDMSAGNLIVDKGQLRAVIDFGLLSVGDPACDLSIAWTYFEQDSRKHFRNQLSIDNETWNRGRAWAFWKALIVAAKISESNAVETQQSKRVITEIIQDYKRND
jgi:aminoglycoside phosphotransferase (APT) family kinase protein